MLGDHASYTVIPVYPVPVSRRGFAQSAREFMRLGQALSSPPDAAIFYRPQGQCGGPPTRPGYLGSEGLLNTALK
jgi:hypothetical protein